jgi:hypothetical protein
VSGIGIALPHFGYDLDYRSRRVPTGRVMLAVIAAQLHYLAEGNRHCEGKHWFQRNRQKWKLVFSNRRMSLKEA